MEILTPRPITKSKPRPTRRYWPLAQMEQTREGLMVAALRSLLNKQETLATRGALRVLIHDLHRELFGEK